jgi:peptidoglycan/LPS O-acetylase OafA/YrhL
MELFQVDTEELESTSGGDDRLARPWPVFIFGVLLSAGFAAVVLVRATDDRVLDDKTSLGMLAFAALATVLSAVYAFVGARFGRRIRKANRRRSRPINYLGRACCAGLRASSDGTLNTMA